MAKWFWRRGFLNFVNVFYLFRYNLSLEKSRALHLNKFESSSRKFVCAKFCWNWLNGSWEEDFLNFVNVFFLFRNYLPLEKSEAFHLNKLESPSPKDVMCPVWLKFATWFWRTTFLNSSMYILLFRNYLPLEKGGILHLKKLESLYPRIHCMYVEIVQVVLDKRIFKFRCGVLHLNKLESHSP